MLMRFDPFREVDRLMGQVGAANRAMPLSFPMDAMRRGDEVVVQLDLPGVDPDAIEVTAERGTLTISAERRARPEEGAQVLVRERPQGRFTRQLMLADSLDTDRLAADYDSGVLTLTIPVAEQAKPRRVAVTSGGSQHTIEAHGTETTSPEAAQGEEPEANGAAAPPVTA